MKRLLPLVILAMITLAGCNDRVQTVETFNSSKRIEIDTLDIHGNKHEVIFWYYNYKGGMMHSPECWCEKTNNNNLNYNDYVF